MVSLISLNECYTSNYTSIHDSSWCKNVALDTLIPLGEGYNSSYVTIQDSLGWQKCSRRVKNVQELKRFDFLEILKK